ncbi:alpha-L-rhamnosidase-related protein [Massilia sp. S19_KUP03_FR1]|uniref:alpha-L-rhamnosidase-related protein n=1 Tax=Massilia sp. S19_KUP03_FR1 TaxID=3025503 RepID=UPI002FCD6E91
MLKPSIAAAVASLCALSGCATTPARAPATEVRDFAVAGAANVQVRFARDGASGYIQSSTMPTREQAPATIRYAEVPGQPFIRTGSVAFDALFAHAISEMKELSVDAIRDGAYNDDQPIACHCFETGEKWHYVWTRDLAYGANLGLAMLDPRRVRDSLTFKLSGYRPGSSKPREAAGTADGLQIIQDTGSGGSWPVSTDRVTWAFGAEQALTALSGPERAAFGVTALKALSNTIENDRIAAFDPRDGLYTGEQSFLDWREQSYGRDIETDLARMATAKALSTNVAHYKALTLAANLAADQSDSARAQRYAAWAAQLKTAINARFWLEDAGMYASLTAAHSDGAPLHKYDWLGLSLAIVTGIADETRRERILASYPHGPVGAPVIFPQQQGVPVYHNRAIWPFVTAYGLDAAIAGANVSVADAAYASLQRGASVHLSNMENMEWLSGQQIVTDAGHPELGGPVVNSRRQLWSVGAYVGMVVRNVFGVRYADDGVHVAPFITARLRRDSFKDSNRIVLDDLSVRGKKLAVRVALPPVSSSEGHYAVDAVTLNGKPVAGGLIAWDTLEEDNLIEVTLGALQAGRQAIRSVAGDPAALSGALFAPREAAISHVVAAVTGIDVGIADAQQAGPVVYRLYRNGVLVADQLKQPAWRDIAPLAQANCYAVEVVDAASGNVSHHSGAVCAEAGILIGVDDARVRSSVARSGARIAGWGAPQDRFSVDQVQLGAGRFSFQVRYTNHGNAINTGISNGVKVLSVVDAAGHTVARRVIQMPHLPPESAPMYSTPADILLKAGTYAVRLDDFYNMSYLEANAVYANGGGKGGALNKVDIFGVRVLPLAGQ